MKINWKLTLCAYQYTFICKISISIHVFVLCMFWNFVIYNIDVKSHDHQSTVKVVGTSLDCNSYSRFNPNVFFRLLPLTLILKQYVYASSFLHSYRLTWWSNNCFRFLQFLHCYFSTKLKTYIPPRKAPRCNIIIDLCWPSSL